MAKAKPRLGRGLSSLMKQPVSVPAATTDPADAPPADTPQAAPEPAQQPESADSGQLEGLKSIPVASIRPNPHQPRQAFGQDALKSLADSIRRDGVMQPVIVRPLDPAAGKIKFELVAGERRWRAAKLVGLDDIPAIVRDLDEHQTAQWALVENLQREDLDPIERAEAFRHLLDRFDLSHEQVAEEVGVNRTTITNALRLLSLADEVQELVRQGMLSNGHAKVLAGLSDASLQKQLAVLAVKQGWSVRRMEDEARKADEPAAQKPSSPGTQRASHFGDLEKQISSQLSTKVQIKPGRKKNSGALIIEFYSVDEFDSLLGRLGVQANVD